jgi:hypothetical protein
MPTRRGFLKSAVAVAGLAGRRASAVPYSEPDIPMWTGFSPEGAFGQLCRDRLTRVHVPEFTEDFVLADIRGDTVRRFPEQSGDLSGRYIGALSSATGDELAAFWLNYARGRA